VFGDERVAEEVLFENMMGVGISTEFVDTGHNQESKYSSTILSVVLERMKMK
jgi:hypothetical protein